MFDPYESGTPKYSTAQNIYDALCELVQTEEMNILSEIGVDVSYDNQTYYYTDKGNDLKERFEKLTEFGDKMWLMDLAIAQSDRCTIHDTIYAALLNTDLAKRIGFKKLFVDDMLRGNGRNYAKITEEFAEELGWLNRFDNYSMIGVWNKVSEANGISLFGVTPYPAFAHHLAEKVQRLELFEEMCLISECRAHLSAYDDFIIGLRANQALYELQEQGYRLKIKELNAEYNEKMQLLMHAAENAGLLPALVGELKALESNTAALSAGAVSLDSIRNRDD